MSDPQPRLPAEEPEPGFREDLQTLRGSTFQWLGGTPFLAVVGLGLPCFCLLLDPAVFRPSVLHPSARLGDVRTMSYGVIGCSMSALLAWMITQRLNSFFCGILAASSVYAIGLGVALLPLTLIGLMIVIGILGLTPFLVAIAYAAAARKARRIAGSRFRAVHAWLACSLFLAVPSAGQTLVLREAGLAEGMLEVEGEEALVEAAVRRLARLSIFYDTDRLVVRSMKTGGKAKKQRLSEAYELLTGEPLEQRMWELYD